MVQEEAVMAIDATQEKMWSIWTDIPNWNQWIGSIESSQLEGDFGNGAKGSLKLVTGQKSSFTIEECVENEFFICRSKILFCTMDAGHEMKAENGKLNVKLYIKIYGPLSFIFKKPVRKQAKALQTALEKLAELAGK
jgi:carbon monoxide dehydrogenase subunit G